MVIEVNVDSLINTKMSASQFIILILLYEQRINTLETYLASIPKSENELNRLKEENYLISWDPLKGVNSIILDNKKTKDLIGLEDSFFWELFSTYPIKVASKGGGARSLRPLSLTAKETLDCKKKYEKYLGKRTAKQKHEHVMKCLNAELWVSNREEHNVLYLIDISNQSAKTERYGEGLI